MQVNLLANGNEELAFESGLRMRAPHQWITKLEAPVIVKIVRLPNSGSVELHWTKERGVIAYAVESSIDNGERWENGSYCRRTRTKMDGYQAGILTQFRVKAIGADVSSDWSPSPPL